MFAVLAENANYIGIIGVLLTLIAYYLLNVNKLASSSMTYLAMNLVGSLLLLFSLCFNWNLPSVLIEVAWVSISLIGIYRWVNQ